MKKVFVLRTRSYREGKHFCGRNDRTRRVSRWQRKNIFYFEMKAVWILQVSLFSASVSLDRKDADKDIKLDSGEIIAQENTVITEELFNKIYEGRSTKVNGTGRLGKDKKRCKDWTNTPGSGAMSGYHKMWLILILLSQVLVSTLGEVGAAYYYYHNKKFVRNGSVGYIAG